jgi:integrase
VVRSEPVKPIATSLSWATSARINPCERLSLPAFVADILAPGEDNMLVFPDSAGGHMRGSNVRRRWWSQAVADAQLFPRTVADGSGEQTTVYDFKLHELRHTAASLAIQAGANIKALQNMLGHESAGLTLDRYGHLYGSDVEAVGIAINALLTRNCGQSVGTGAGSSPTLRLVNGAWSALISRGA